MLVICMFYFVNVLCQFFYCDIRGGVRLFKKHNVAFIK